MPPASTADLPYRLVDHENYGWLVTTAGDYRADDREASHLPPMTLQALTDERAPWRPVLPITDADEALLRDVFRAAGRKTITSLAAALDDVFYRLRESAGGLAKPQSYPYTRRTLTAGRPGSWESEALFDVIWFGNELNLAPAGRRMDNGVEARRQRGPKPRVDPEARRVLTEIILRWVTDPDRYTEVAENLAHAVSAYADDTAGPHGWREIADRWLQPSTAGHQNFRACYRLLYSTSAYFNPTRL